MRPAVSPPRAPGHRESHPSLPDHVPQFYSDSPARGPGDSKQDPDGRSPADRDGAELETPLPGFPNASQTSVLEASGALLLGWRGAERTTSLTTGPVTYCWRPGDSTGLVFPHALFPQTVGRH